MRNPATKSTTNDKQIINNKTTTPCCSKIGLKRGPWTAEEDELLSTYINKEGEGRWRTLPKRAGLLRCGKSCRLRWMNYLRPSVKRGHITYDEEDLILRLHRLLGNRYTIKILGSSFSLYIWSFDDHPLTSERVNHYMSCHLSKKLISQGIDPRTHKPLNPQALLNKASNSSSSKLIKTAASSSAQITAAAGEENEYDHYQNHNRTDDQGCGIEMRNQNKEIIFNEEYDDEDVDYCTDDVFSSFLDSLINEDAFADQNPANGIVQADASDWESVVDMSTDHFNQNGPNRVNE